MRTAIVYYSAHHGNTRKLAEAVAQVKGMDPDEAARITLENGIRFFGIEENLP